MVLLDFHFFYSKEQCINCFRVSRATAEALAAQVTQENFEKGLIYPPFSNIRKISAHIAAKVAAKAYDLGKLLSNMLNAGNCPLAFH